MQLCCISWFVHLSHSLIIPLIYCTHLSRTDEQQSCSSVLDKWVPSWKGQPKSSRIVWFSSPFLKKKDSAWLALWASQAESFDCAQTLFPFFPSLPHKHHPFNKKEKYATCINFINSVICKVFVWSEKTFFCFLGMLKDYMLMCKKIWVTYMKYWENP